MDYYTEAEFSHGKTTLKSFREKFSGKPVLLEKALFPAEGSKLKADGFPKRLKIALEPEEMIFKNIKSSLKDEKTLLQTIRFESRKYFKIDEDKFIFTHNIWKKEGDFLWFTLLGLGSELMENYVPFIRAGFVPWFVIKEFLCDDKGAVFNTKRIGGEKESLRIYYDGSLIGWKIYGKEDPEEIKTKAEEYITSLGLPLQVNTINKAMQARPAGKTTTFPSGPHISAIKQSLMKHFLRFSAGGVILMIVMFLTSAAIQLNLKLQNLKMIEDGIQKLQNQYQITDLQSVRKKADVKGVEISRVIFDAGKRFPKDNYISRFEYKEGEAAITIRNIDILRANKIEEALENENNFTQFRIEEGAANNDKRIVFRVKR